MPIPTGYQNVHSKNSIKNEGFTDGQDHPLTAKEYDELLTCYSVDGGTCCIPYNLTIGIPLIPVCCCCAWYHACLRANGSPFAAPHRDRFNFIYRSCCCVPKQIAYPCACPCADDIGYKQVSSAPQAPNSMAG